MVALPRVVIAAAASGQGKTTIAVGLMAALRRQGLQVAPFKVGPDFIDPGYHTLATGRVGRNLDAWMCGTELMAPLLAYGSRVPEPADIAVIEGVMGLFDGRLGTAVGADVPASTAQIAYLTDSPVILVIDISSAAGTIAAVVQGLANFDKRINIAGVILNKAGSESHAAQVRQQVEATGMPVLGVLFRDAGIEAPSRHLGLVPVAERVDAERQLQRLAQQIAQGVDLAAVRKVARSAADLSGPVWSPRPATAPATMTGVKTPQPVVALAGGRAFTFRYAEITELLQARGLRCKVFDPVQDTQLPAHTAGIYLGGGFPEVHLPDLAGNTEMLQEIRQAAHAGVPIVAECAGMLYLQEALDDQPLAGVLPARAAMTGRLTLGYRELTLAGDSPLGLAGSPARGHEFHHTQSLPVAGEQPAWQVGGRGAAGFIARGGGSSQPNIHASYMHTHWVGQEHLADSFAAAVHDWGRELGAYNPQTNTAAVHDWGQEMGAHTPQANTVGGTPTGPKDPWRHHGDVEAVGLRDFAVNVRSQEPPEWLQETLRAALSHLGQYPDIRQARAALAARHGLRPDRLLPTAGAAEAFLLLARVLPGRRSLIVHPQFTEPDAAMRAVGRSCEHLILSGDFSLDAESLAAIDKDVDLIYIGNPTNPTGVLHSREQVLALRKPGRLLVVDEAFMDLMPPGNSLLEHTPEDDLVVLRSLTKTWGIAGLRAGYVVASAQIIAQLAAAQPHWSVNSLAAAAMEAVSTPQAQEQEISIAAAAARQRAYLVGGLQKIGVTVTPGHAPFVLAQVGKGVHAHLRASGYAVRRCDTFPGLDDSWVRIAVRDTIATDGLLRALAAARESLGIAAPGLQLRSKQPGKSSANTPKNLASARQNTPGEVVLVGAGPGHADLLTIGAHQALQKADVIITDRLVPAQAIAGLSAEIVHVGKIPRGAFTPQERINALIIDHALSGRTVVRLKGGDSFVFGRGAEEIRACQEAGISTTVIPGVSSAIAVPALAGIPLTVRGINQGFCVISGHVPPRDKRAHLDWQALSHTAQSGVTLVILMGVKHLPAIVRELISHGLNPHTPAAAIASGGTPQQQIIRAEINDLPAAAAALDPPAITVIGPAITALEN